MLGVPSMASRLREVRTQQLGYTQPELAEKLEIRPISISRWERGVSTPSMPNLRKLSAISGKPVSWFFEDAA